MQLDVVLGIPGKRIQGYGFYALAAIENTGEQDAVVVATRFGAKHCDPEHPAAAARQNLLHGACTRHAVADHD